MQAHADDVRRTRSGIIIIGRGDTLRAVDPFMGQDEGGAAYADVVNRYQRTFKGKARVFCMVIPTAIALYCPDSARTWTRNEWAAIDRLYKRLLPEVTAVELADTLRAHAHEPIYSRTDHHWAPLGAYYAARAFSAAAHTKACSLSDFDERTVANYVGTMYRFSRDMAVKQASEEFVYYVPRDTAYQTTYIRYTLDRKHQVSGEKPAEQGPFFYPFADGSSAAYLTFMHGDLSTTTVRTATRNGRRLLLLKDSFGNALPPFLFQAFEEIHVVDCRYFLRNIVSYAEENGITDILFANNAGHAFSAATQKAYNRYLEQHPK